jgi:hypothetical protein
MGDIMEDMCGVLARDRLCEVAFCMR